MQRVLSIITARGGSKGLPKKNLLDFNGKPLIGWTIEASLGSSFITKTIVSSDDEEILSIAKKYHPEIPVKRSKALSQDDTSSIDVVLDIVQHNKNFDYIVLLQPTSPLRTFKHIDEAFHLMTSQKGFCCASVYEVKKSPFWMYIKNDEGYITKLVDSNSNYTQRQKLPKVYGLNGALYIISVSELLTKKTLITNECIPYIMDKETSIDIDDIYDFNKAQKIHKNLLIK